MSWYVKRKLCGVASILEKITVVIPVLNEELNLPKCLDALVGFPNVVVIDSGSTDKTHEICSERSINVVPFNWDGKFPKKRNWFLENCQIYTDWVFFLDADEVVTLPFKMELEKKLAAGDSDGFFVFYENFFMGSKMRFGIPQRKLSIFKKNYRFERIELQGTSDFDMEIHEHPVGLTKIGRIRARVQHDDFKGISHFINKHRIYAEWECERYFSVKKSETLTSRQRFKYKLLGKSYFPWLYFLLDYIIFARFLDGKAGLAYSKYKKWYFGLIKDFISERMA